MSGNQHSRALLTMRKTGWLMVMRVTDQAGVEGVILGKATGLIKGMALVLVPLQ
jgi:hypothetical protein